MVVGENAYLILWNENMAEMTTLREDSLMYL
jgi:hypothetical protein